jgi:LysM repeat protein
MNNPSPLVPQGSTIDQKQKGRARVKLAVFFVLAVHGVGLLALLVQGCHQDLAQTSKDTNALPVFDATNAPAVVEPSTTPALTNTSAVAEATNTAPATASEYTVARGDTFSTIGKKFGVSAKAIMDANPTVEATKLQVGKKLQIPAATKTAVASSTGAPASETASGEHPYTVKSGDTLIKIASEHHTSVKAIRAANSLKTDRITVGQKLKLPAKSAASPGATETASANPTLPAGAPLTH